MSLSDYKNEKELQEDLSLMLEGKVRLSNSELVDYLKKPIIEPVIEQQIPIESPVVEEDETIENAEPIQEPVQTQPINKAQNKIDKYLDEYEPQSQPQAAQTSSKVLYLGGGENNSITNVGNGIGIYRDKYGSDLRLRSVLGSGIANLSVINDTIVIDVSSSPDDNFVTLSEMVSAASNDVFLVNETSTNEYKKIKFENLVCGLSGMGEDNEGQNVGSANEVFKEKSGVTLQFRTLSAGENIQIVSAADTLTITASDSSVLNTYRISELNGDFATPEEAFTYFHTLSAQTDGVRLVIDAGEYEINNTIDVDLGFIVDIEGAGFNTTILKVGSGLYDASELDDALKSDSMFSLKSEVHFRRLGFDSTEVSAWRNYSGARYICFNEAGNNVYVEIKDFRMNGAYVGVCVRINADVFVFDGIIANVENGIGVDIASSALSGGSIDVEVANFENCNNGIHLISGTNFEVFVDTVRFLQETSAQTSISYHPESFDYSSFTVGSLETNRIGQGFDGFDFTLQRDANIELHNLIGEGNRKPLVKIIVDNNTSATTTTNSNEWYKVAFTPATISATNLVKFSSDGNKITYLPSFNKDLKVLISGNIQSSAQPRTVTIAMVKNGDTTNGIIFSRSVRSTASGSPFVFNLTGLTPVQLNDYYEIYIRSTTGNMDWTITDMDWLTYSDD